MRETVQRNMLVTDAVFSYERADTKELFYFNTDLLERIRQQQPGWFRRITLDVIPEIYDLVLLGRGIEEAHLKTLSAERLEEPGLGIHFDDGAFVLVDGNHRLVERYRRGLKSIDVWATVSGVWQLCQVNPCPELKTMMDAERPALPAGTNAAIVSKARLHDPI